MAAVSHHGDCGLPSGTFKSQKGGRADLVWLSEVLLGRRDPYQSEWDSLIAAIRDDQPYDNVESGAKATLVTSMRRRPHTPARRSRTTRP